MLPFLKTIDVQNTDHPATKKNKQANRQAEVCIPFEWVMVGWNRFDSYLHLVHHRGQAQRVDWRDPNGKGQSGAVHCPTGSESGPSFYKWNLG